MLPFILGSGGELKRACRMDINSFSFKSNQCAEGHIFSKALSRLLQSYFEVTSSELQTP